MFAETATPSTHCPSLPEALARKIWCPYQQGNGLLAGGTRHLLPGLEPALEHRQSAPRAPPIFGGAPALLAVWWMHRCHQVWVGAVGCYALAAPPLADTQKERALQTLWEMLRCRRVFAGAEAALVFVFLLLEGVTVEWTLLALRWNH